MIHNVIVILSGPKFILVPGNSKDSSPDMIKLFATVFLLLSVAAQNVFTYGGDEVKLKNGDRLTGKIISQDEEQIVIETEYAGKVTINAAHVEKIADETATTEGAEIAKKEGEAEEEREAEPAAKDEAKPAEPASAAIEQKPRFFGGRLFWGIVEGWDGNANIGFNYTTGNSRTSTMTTGLRAVKTAGNDKLTVYMRSLWYNNRRLAANNTTQNAVWGGLRYDRNFSERRFAFGSYDFERDRPRRLYYRSVLGGGLGHRLIRNERTELELLAGGAWNRTWQFGPNTDTPEALVGNSFKHRFNGRLRVQQTFTFFQNVADRNEFRFIFDSSVIADVTRKIGIHFTVGDRFNNDPPPNARRNDFLFTTGIRFNFGKRN